MQGYGNAQGNVPQAERRSIVLLNDMAANNKRLFEISERLGSLLVRVVGPSPSPAPNGKDGLSAIPTGLSNQFGSHNQSAAALLDQCERTLGQLEDFV